MAPLSTDPPAAVGDPPEGAEPARRGGQDELRSRRAERLCGALEAVASRVHFKEQKRHQAAVVLQTFARGLAARLFVHRFRREMATRRLLAVWRRFKAQRQLLELRSSEVDQRAAEMWRGALETALARLLLREMKDRTRAAIVVSRHVKGMQARKCMRLMLINRRSFERLRPLRCIWSRVKAQAHLLRLHEEQRVRAQREIWHAAVRTFKLRLLLDFTVINERESNALSVIAGHISAMYDRRRPKVMQVTQHLNRLRVEQEDRRNNIRQRAVYRLQMKWRSWVQRQRELAGKIVESLAGEWRARRELTEAEAPFLEHLDGSGALQAVHVRVLRADPVPAAGWADALAGTVREAADMCVGVDFAACVGRDGSASLAQAELVDGRRVLSEPRGLKFRGPKLDRFRNMPMPPFVSAVACGSGHALFVTRDGILFAWGHNDRTQCGMGGPAALGGELEQKYFKNPTCVQPWASGGSFDPQAEPTEKAGGGGLPRVRFVACGPRHSSAIDLGGSVWMWGFRKGIGLDLLRSRARPGKQPAQFLLFNLSWSAGVSDKGPVKAGVVFQGEVAELKRSSKLGLVVQNGHEPSKAAEKDGSAAKVGPRSVQKMLEEALEECDAEVLDGDVGVPTICGALTSSPAGGEKWRSQETVVAGRDPGRAITLGAARGEHNSKFVELECTLEANFAVTERAQLYSWGRAGRSCMLGRTIAAGPSFADLALVPVRIPSLVRMSITVLDVAVGFRHVSLLTGHGRVFTWGTMEACLGPEGFKQHVLQEPVFLEGPLGGVHVARIAAGRTETVVSLRAGDAVLGWEMIEVGPGGGQKMIPAVYEYPMLAKDPSEGEVSRLAFPHSEAFEMLLVERGAPRPAARRAGSGATTPASSVASTAGVYRPPSRLRLGPAPSPAPSTAASRAGTARPNGGPAVGSCDRALFEWAASAGEAEIPELSQWRAEASSKFEGKAIVMDEVLRPRSNLEVAGDLQRYRWLQDRLEGPSGQDEPQRATRRRGGGGKRFPGSATPWGLGDFPRDQPSHLGKRKTMTTLTQI